MEFLWGLIMYKTFKTVLSKWWAFNVLVIIILLLVLILLLLQLLWAVCISLLISVAGKDRHHLQFTNEITKHQKLAQGHRARRNEHVFESFSTWFQSPFYSIASGSGSFSKSKGLMIVWRERIRKKLNTEEHKWVAVVCTVVGRRVWSGAPEL